MKMHEIVVLFQNKCPELVKAMKESDHNYSNEKINKFHMESDVWAHTMQVCLLGEIFKVNDLVKIAALLHDVGKPAARTIDDEKQRVRFFGHEGLSVFYGYQAIQQMGLDLSHEALSRLMNVISHHTALYKVFESGDPLKTVQNKFKGNRALLEDLIWTSKCDALGRFTDQDNSNAQNLENILKPALDALDDNIPKSHNGPTATVLCGPPLSGKSTYIRKNLGDSVLLCRDDILMSMGKSSNYEKVWADADQEAVNKEFQRQKDEAIKARKNIVFDLTNCSPKSRRASFSGLPGEYQKKAVVFYTGYDEIMRRNEIRAKEEQKYIKPHVIHQFMMSFMSPLYDEVDEIENIF